MILQVYSNIFLTKNTIGGFWQGELLSSTGCNSICSLLANVQMDSIFVLQKDEANQDEKAVPLISYDEFLKENYSFFGFCLYILAGDL